MNELRGMAAGADVPFTVALMYTMEEEFSYLVPEALRYSLADHCSDVLIMEDDQRFFLSSSPILVVLAHNEDGVDVDRNRTFLLHMKITRGSFPVSPLPQTTSFSPTSRRTCTRVSSRRAVGSMRGVDGSVRLQPLRRVLDELPQDGDRQSLFSPLSTV